ncbi:hypothetical protein ACFSTA_12025 [Ornithinibacillus salinisoli]|uniref:Uncharacterized protein n=1 Tax=Ornithinibacillus salinisoli TaxID=1848459 RepID=A0ABW4W2U2_9BACI
MQEIFDFLAGNIIFVIIIIGAILRLLGGSKENEQEKRGQNPRPRQNPEPRPTATPSGGQRQRNNQPVKQNETAAQTISIEDQQQQQLERLAGRMNTSKDQSMDDLTGHSSNLGETFKQPKRNIDSHKEENYRKQIKGNLSRNGLVNSVIMAEVLGSPRAKKPYRSVIADRKR